MDLDSLLSNLDSTFDEVQITLQGMMNRIDTMLTSIGKARRQVVSTSPLESTTDEAIAPVFTSTISNSIESLKEFSIDCDEVIIDGDEEVSQGDANIVEEQGFLSMGAKEISISPKGIHISDSRLTMKNEDRNTDFLDAIIFTVFVT